MKRKKSLSLLIRPTEIAIYAITTSLIAPRNEFSLDCHAIARNDEQKSLYQNLKLLWVWLSSPTSFPTMRYFGLLSSV